MSNCQLHWIGRLNDLLGITYNISLITHEKVAISVSPTQASAVQDGLCTQYYTKEIGYHCN